MLQQLATPPQVRPENCGHSSRLETKKAWQRPRSALGRLVALLVEQETVDGAAVYSLVDTKPPGSSKLARTVAPSPQHAATSRHGSSGIAAMPKGSHQPAPPHSAAAKQVEPGERPTP